MKLNLLSSRLSKYVMSSPVVSSNSYNSVKVSINASLPATSSFVLALGDKIFINSENIELIDLSLYSILYSLNVFSKPELEILFSNPPNPDTPFIPDVELLAILLLPPLALVYL